MHASDLRREFDAVTAVDGVDLAVEPGEIYGFLGPNGAGKSTCVRMLCTLLVPTSGTATVAGFDVVGDAGDVRRRIGVALQDVALDDKLTGRQMLRHQGQLYGLSHRRISQRIVALQDLVDMSAIDRQIGTYSGGMRRRLDLAAALIHEPEVVFFDEPTTGLDPDVRLRVWSEIERLNREAGTTVFLTTQYLDEADRLAHRLGILRRGRLAVEGSPNELKQRLGAEIITVQVDGDPHEAQSVARALDHVGDVEVTGSAIIVTSSRAAEVVGPLAVALERRRVVVRTLHMSSPTLDDVFFAVTGAHFDDEAPG